MNNLIPYIKNIHHCGAVSYTKLNPTGKWKISSGPHYKNELFIQHQGIFFKAWILENMIEFLPEKKEQIFSCK